MTDLATAAGDGRNDADRVAVLRRRILLRQITDIFVVDVDVHEAAQLAVFGKKMSPQIGELGCEMSEGFTDSVSIELGRVALAGVRAKRGGDHYFHGHFVSPLLFGRRAKPQRVVESQYLQEKIPGDRRSNAKKSSLAARRSAR